MDRGRRRGFLRPGALSLAGLTRFSSLARAAEEGFVQMLGTPQDLATPTTYFDRLITPNDVFFVRSHFGAPAPNAARRLRISGLVKQPLDLAIGELASFPQ